MGHPPVQIVRVVLFNEMRADLLTLAVRRTTLTYPYKLFNEVGLRIASGTYSLFKQGTTLRPRSRVRIVTTLYRRRQDPTLFLITPFTTRGKSDRIVMTSVLHNLGVSGIASLPTRRSLLSYSVRKHVPRGITSRRLPPNLFCGLVWVICFLLTSHRKLFRRRVVSYARRQGHDKRVLTIRNSVSRHIYRLKPFYRLLDALRTRLLPRTVRLHGLFPPSQVQVYCTRSLRLIQIFRHVRTMRSHPVTHTRSSNYSLLPRDFSLPFF